MLHQIQDGVPFTLSQLQNHWAKLWYGNNDPLTILRSSASAQKSLGTLGANIITQVGKIFIKDSNTIAAIDMPYEIPVGNHRLCGAIDLIREVGPPSERRIEIDMFGINIGKAIPGSVVTKHHYPTIAASWAYRHLMERKESRCVIFNMYVSAYHTRRIIKKADYNRLRAAVEAYVAGTTAKHYYPRPSIACSACEWRSNCEHTEEY